MSSGATATTGTATSISTVPAARPTTRTGPSRSKRSIIAWLRASISAVNVPTPSSSARALITSSSRVPRPRAAASTDGDPVEALARYAESVDLLVLGSHAYHPTDSLLAGSTAQRLADQAPCPLLVLARDRVTPAS